MTELGAKGRTDDGADDPRGHRPTKVKGKKGSGWKVNGKGKSVKDNGQGVKREKGKKCRRTERVEG